MEKIKDLKDEGYAIESVTNRGYCMAVYNDILTASGIKAYLEDEYKILSIHIFKSLESTNKTAMKMALDNAPHGTIIISNSQTHGKGKSNRSFFSPGDSGIYLSIILNSQGHIFKPTVIMAAISLAVCLAIEKLFKNIEPCIKWINDIYVNDIKVCEILTDGIINSETGDIDFIIPGIGVNFQNLIDGFPLEFQNNALSLKESDPSAKNILRNEFIAEIINQIMNVFPTISSNEFLNEYKKRFLLLGKKVWIICNDVESLAIVIGIDDDGGLIIKFSNNNVQTIYNTDTIIKIV